MDITIDTERLDGTLSADARAVLHAAGLPSEDLGDVIPTYTARAVGPLGLAGVAALEVIAPVGLVRSVAVVPEQRNLGVGAGLVGALIELARDQGLTSLYLLTEGAADYFGRLGFRATPREEAPPPIQETAQFSRLCPETATLMRRSLP